MVILHYLILRRFFLSIGFLGVFLSSGLSFAACTGSVCVENGWTRATPPNAQFGSAYLTITNNGNTPEYLVSGLADFADRIEIHSMKMNKNSVMQMYLLEEGVKIPAGQSITLKPGGTHIMFFGLNKPFIFGTKIKFDLVFKNSGTLPVVFDVERLGAKQKSVSY